MAAPTARLEFEIAVPDNRRPAAQGLRAGGVVFLIRQHDGAVLCSSSSSLPPPPKQAVAPNEAVPPGIPSEPSGGEIPGADTSAFWGSIPAEMVHKLPCGASSGTIRSLQCDPPLPQLHSTHSRTLTFSLKNPTHLPSLHECFQKSRSRCWASLCQSCAGSLR